MKIQQQHRIAVSALFAGLLIASGAVGAQTVTVPGVGVGAGARVESNTSAGTTGASQRGTAGAGASAGARTDAAGVSVPPTTGLTNTVGGVVGGTTGAVGGATGGVQDSVGGVATGTTGEPLTVNVAYRAHRPVEDPVFGYMIHTENDTPVAGTNTRLSGLETGMVEGDGIIAIEMDELPLLPGNYEFTIGINDKFVQHTYDRHYRSHPLAVRRGIRPIGVGFVDLAATWNTAGTDGRTEVGS
jgi:hypothetical protein